LRIDRSDWQQKNMHETKEQNPSVISNRINSHGSACIWNRL